MDAFTCPEPDASTLSFSLISRNLASASRRHHRQVHGSPPFPPLRVLSCVGFICGAALALHSGGELVARWLLWRLFPPDDGDGPHALAASPGDSAAGIRPGWPFPAGASPARAFLPMQEWGPTEVWLTCTLGSVVVVSASCA